MTTEEKKQELKTIIAMADDDLTNVLMEAAVEYQTTAKEEFVVPKEWIEEFEKRSNNLSLGITSPCNPYETIEIAKQKLAEFKKQHNHAL